MSVTRFPADVADPDHDLAAAERVLELEEIHYRNSGRGKVFRDRARERVENIRRKQGGFATLGAMAAIGVVGGVVWFGRDFLFGRRGRS